jgi:hypothetical protein
MTEREKLLAEIEAFLVKTGMGATRFGVEAKGEGPLLNRLRAGGGVGIDTAKKIRDFMRTYKQQNPKKRRPVYQPAA